MAQQKWGQTRSQRLLDWRMVLVRVAFAILHQPMSEKVAQDAESYRQSLNEASFRILLKESLPALRWIVIRRLRSAITLTIGGFMAVALLTLLSRNRVESDNDWRWVEVTNQVSLPTNTFAVFEFVKEGPVPEIFDDGKEKIPSSPGVTVERSRLFVSRFCQLQLFKAQSGKRIGMAIITIRTAKVLHIWEDEPGVVRNPDGSRLNEYSSVVECLDALEYHPDFLRMVRNRMREASILPAK